MSLQHSLPLYRWHALAAHHRTHAVLAGVVAVYIAAATALARFAGKPEVLDPFLYLPGVAALFGFCAVLWGAGYLGWVALAVRPERPLSWAWQHLRERARFKTRVLRGMTVVLLLIPFYGYFTSVKSLIPVVMPYSWDPALHAFDRWLFGVDPWRLFEPMMQVPYALFVLNFFYNIWFFLKFLFVLWQAFTLRDEQLRLQFLLAFLLTWVVVGSVLALGLSSAGPCFYSGVVPGPDPYAGLMAHLHAARELAPLWALDAQAMLWQLHNENTLGVGGGISAMPSMHVAVATLLWLLARRVDRRAGWVFAAYLALIAIGSVVLGWHYAADGLLAIPLALVIWTLSGRIARRVQAV